ncbi:hypothetical protein BKA65DRAFT_442032 [Rhexocercosporidium sp. MPI-PUGE-AT-0058]|nr:hypothetical protein BKA65DRAFT_442032 [Rhexocercosporidium sp. MPI-PUGE-AT-0058]
MHIDKHGDVSIAELIVFIPCVFLGIAVCLRQGFKRTAGWIFVVILSVIRVAGAVCQLLTYNNPTEGLIKATLILDSIGLAPLLLTVLGMLSRLIEWINPSMQNPKINSKVFRIVQLVIGVSLILGILGVTAPSSQAANGTFTPPTISKVGITLNILVFIVLTTIFILSLPHSSALPHSEQPLRIYIPVALVAIFVRVLYAMLCIFVHNSTFSLFNGSIVTNVLMAIVEEFFVVIITIALGFKLGRTCVEVETVVVDVNQKDANGTRELSQMT